MNTLHDSRQQNRRKRHIVTYRRPPSDNLVIAPNNRHHIISHHTIENKNKFFTQFYLGAKSKALNKGKVSRAGCSHCRVEHAHRGVAIHRALGSHGYHYTFLHFHVRHVQGSHH